MIDILFAIIIVIALIKGWQKGLVVAVFSIIAFIIGLAAALKLSAVVADYLGNEVSVSKKWLPFLSFLLVFIVVVVLVNLGGKLIQKTFEMAFLGWANRIGGIVFFTALYTIIFSILLFYAGKVHLFSEEAFQKSVVWPYVKPWGPAVMDGFGKIIPVFKDMFSQLENFFADVSDKLQH